jgi:hypothetical protein
MKNKTHSCASVLNVARLKNPVELKQVLWALKYNFWEKFMFESYAVKYKILEF